MEPYDKEVKYYLNILNSNEAKKYSADKKGEKKELLDLFDELLKYNESNLNEFEAYLNNIDNPEEKKNIDNPEEKKNIDNPEEKQNIIYYNMPINYENE